MIRNLFLALFLFAVAFPAALMPAPAAASHTVAVSCHDSAPMKQSDDDRHGVAVKHVCIGCVPMTAEFLFMAAVSPRAVSPAAQILPKLMGTCVLPALPPPRAF
jgi:hypothetical protein